MRAVNLGIKSLFPLFLIDPYLDHRDPTIAGTIKAVPLCLHNLLLSPFINTPAMLHPI